MRHKKTLSAALALVAFIGAGTIYAQPAPAPAAPPPAAPTPAGPTAPTPAAPTPAPADSKPDITAAGEAKADLSPREMASETKRLLTEMEGYHVRVLQLQGAARKSKDVIKLNCVNEKLLAVKQLLNIGESAENDLTEAIASSDRDAQVHQYSQVRLAHERSTAARDEAEGCIGEEIIFVGPTQVDVDGPAMPDDPTDDPDDPFSAVPTEDFEQANAASPWF